MTRWSSHVRFFELKRGEIGANEMADREPLSNLQPIFSCGLVMVSSETHSAAFLPNLQKRCATIRLWSGLSIAQ